MTNKKPDDFEATRQITKLLEDFDRTERERIIRWALEKLGDSLRVAPVASVTEGQIGPNKQTQDNINTGTSESPSIKRPVDIKTFINEKDPNTDVHLATAIAYYYAFEAIEDQRKPTIGTEDLTEATRLAGRKRPTQPRQVLRNAKVAGYLDSPERGHYKINAVGENLVAMVLPDTPARTKSTNTKKTKKKSGSGKSKKKVKKKTTKKR